MHGDGAAPEAANVDPIFYSHTVLIQVYAQCGWVEARSQGSEVVGLVF